MHYPEHGRSWGLVLNQASDVSLDVPVAKFLRLSSVE